MKRFFSFLWRYKYVIFVVLAIVAGGVLQLLHHTTSSHWVLGVVAIIGAIRIATRTWEEFRHGQYGLDILGLTAIVAAVALHQYWTAIVLVLVIALSAYMERYALRRARAGWDIPSGVEPATARLLKGSKTVEASVETVRSGDKLVIDAGEVVPVDATILDGSASFDESLLTGESLPQLRAIGQRILGGSVLQEGSVTVRALHAAAESQYRQLDKLMRAAGHSQAPFTRAASRFSIPFTIAALSIAVVAWVISGQAIRFLDVLVVATPYPLLVAAPVALTAAIDRVRRQGSIIKNGAALENLADIRTMAFGKTGTLTVGEPAVANITTFGSFKKDEVLAVAASLEQNSAHVLARAIVAAADKKKLSYSKAKHVSELPGQGLIARLKSKTILVGRHELMLEQDIAMPTAFKPASVAQTACYVAIEGALAGIIVFNDEIRPEASANLTRLRALGVKDMVLLTGDHQPAAKTIATALAITNVRANALLADKLQVIQKIEEQPVAFVGDGVSDAAVLTAADLGIALGAAGETTASDAADVVVLQNDLRAVTAAMTTAQRAFRIAKQSIVIGMLLSFVLMALFATGKISPIIGAVLQAVIDVLVVLNALRACRISTPQA